MLLFQNVSISLMAIERTAELDSRLLCILCCRQTGYEVLPSQLLP